MLFSRSQVRGGGGWGGCISTEIKMMMMMMMMMIKTLFSLNLMQQQEWELKYLRSHLRSRRVNRQSCTSAVFDNLI